MSNRGRPGPAPNAASALFNSGVAHHQAGRLQEASGVYRQVLAAMPNHFDAKHLLGVVALQTGKLDEAQALIARPPLPVVAPGVVCCARPALGRRERAAAVLGVS